MDNSISLGSISSTAVPYITKKLYSQLSGLSEDTVRGMVDRGHLPSVKIGKQRMVNVALLTREALESEY